MGFYTLRHFDIRSFVPPETYDALGDASMLVMDYRILKTADELYRFFYGRQVLINNWVDGGTRLYNGFHPLKHDSLEYSQHRAGRAIDFTVYGLTADEVRQKIILHPELFPYITAIEIGPPWLHVDCRCTTSYEIQIIEAGV